MRSISAFDRAVNTTLAPAAANSATLASPIPRLAPVIKTIFSDKSIAQSLVNMGHADHGTGRENHATP